MNKSAFDISYDITIVKPISKNNTSPLSISDIDNEIKFFEDNKYFNDNEIKILEDNKFSEDKNSDNNDKSNKLSYIDAILKNNDDFNKFSKWYDEGNTKTYKNKTFISILLSSINEY